MKKVDGQLIELAGRNWLVSQLIQAGIEVVRVRGWRSEAMKSDRTMASRPTRAWLILIIFACSMTIQSCSSVDELQPQFGIVALTVEGGRQIYFKREVRGLSYDVLAVSDDPDPCHTANDAADYVFRAQGPLTVYYKLEGPKLVVYSASPGAASDKSEIPRLIDARLLEAPEFQQFGIKYHEKGFTKLDVPLNVPIDRC